MICRLTYFTFLGRLNSATEASFFMEKKEKRGQEITPIAIGAEDAVPG